MAENIEIKTEAKESKMGNFAKWCSNHSGEIFAGAMVLGMIGAVAGISIASVRSDERVKKAKLEDKAAERALQEKWMDVQLECAKIEADAFVRKETATTNDIANIVKTMKE